LDNEGAVLSDIEIRALCVGDKPLIIDAPDFEKQIQPTGFDVTVKRITKMEGCTTVGGPNRSKVAEEYDVELVDGYYNLAPGAYLVYINEYTNFPDNIVGLAFARSILFRSGGMLETGVWDAGFSGRGRLGLFVYGVESMRIEQGCHLAQLIFLKSSRVGKGFEFNYLYKEESSK
jgi:dUTP pyrophosphatase